MSAAFGSDDDDESEDDDYNPLADKTAEREDLAPSAAPGGGRGSKSRTKRRRGAAINVAAAAADGDGDEEREAEDGDGDEDDRQQQQQQQQEEEERYDPRAEAKRAKVAELWVAINARAAAKGTGSTARLPSASLCLAELCRSASASAPAAAAPAAAAAAAPGGGGGGGGGVKRKGGKAADPDAMWKRSLGLLPKASGPKPSVSAILAKTTAAAAAAPPPPGAVAAAAAIAAAAGAGAAAPGSEPGSEGGGGGAGVSDSARAAAAAALAAARDAAAVGARANKVAVTETRRFAGKDIQVTVHVDKESKEAQQAAARAAAPPPAAVGGLDAMLAEMEKKKKVSVLDKTKADWSEYKASNTTVEEELEAYKKSSDQYLDKQSFLKRAELREYEKERDTRLASDVRTRGRL